MYANDIERRRPSLMKKGLKHALDQIADQHEGVIRSQTVPDEEGIETCGRRRWRARTAPEKVADRP